MLAAAIGVKLSSPGPVLFKQRRYGLSGKTVEVWKFRTMAVHQDSADIPQAQRDDPRVTRFGAFLRRTSLDELPQFINVLQGRMSVIGPRPHAVAHAVPRAGAGLHDPAQGKARHLRLGAGERLAG